MDPDIDGPYAKINYTYDELSRVIRTRYFDSENLEIVRVMFVVVRSVLPGSMAERIGLAPGDWIISYNGEKVTSVHQLVQLVTDARGPASRILVIHRGFTILNFEVAAGLLGINIEAAPAELEVTPRE
jgi:S1-C subfamily serine protease